MMQAAELIRIVDRAGGHLEPDGDSLVVEAPEPLPEPIMAELRAHKVKIIDFLNRPGARVVLLHCPPGVPEAWTQGVADLLTMARPAACPEPKWISLRRRVPRCVRLAAYAPFSPLGGQRCLPDASSSRSGKGAR